MNFETAEQFWAPLIAAVIGAAVAIFIVIRLLQDSARGRLAAQVGILRRREKAAKKAVRAVQRARKKLEKLQSRADAVKPRHIEETEGRLEDALALQKIADDQVLIARNLVRKIILEEYPPKRQEPMRRKLLPDAPVDKRPFAIDG